MQYILKLIHVILSSYDSYHFNIELLNRLPEHFFNPFGYSALWLLSESHFAVHTFPEHNQSYIELSSCVKLQFDKFLQLKD